MSTTTQTLVTQPPAPQPRTSRSQTNVREKPIKSKESSKCTSPTTEEKKLPPIKAPVGLAKGPDLKNIKSKVGSFQNLKHQPAKGEKKQITQKLEWRAQSKIGSLDYAHHRPGGGERKLVNQKLEWKVSSKIGSLENVKHRPGGGQIKIFNEKYSARSVSEVRRPRAPSQIRSTSPIQQISLEKLNGQTEKDQKNNSSNLAKPNVNQEQKSDSASKVHSTRLNSGGMNASKTNGIQQKQINNSNLINDLENLSINKPTGQINNVQKPVVADLLS